MDIPNDLPIIIGQKIKKYIEVNKLENKDFGDPLGISSSHMTKLLNGNRKSFNYNQLWLLSKLYSFDLNELITNEPKTEMKNIIENGGHGSNNIQIINSKDEQIEALKKVIASQEETIKSKDEMIMILKEKIALLNK